MKSKQLHIIFSLFTVMIFAVSFTSCKSTKKTLKKPLNAHGFEFLYNKMKTNQVQMSTFSAKLHLVYTKDGKSKTELKGQLRMKKDSVIWLSISPALGIEAMRLEMTPDSVKLINRLSKTYFLGDYLSIKSLVNTTIDFSIVEALLLGNDLSQYDVQKYKVKVDGNLYNISIKKRRKMRKYIRNQKEAPQVLVQDFWIDPFTYRIRKMKINEFGDNSKSLRVVYDEYQPLENQLLPMKVLIEIIAKKHLLIEVNYRKPELNGEVRFPFKIPSKYKAMELNGK